MNSLVDRHEDKMVCETDGRFNWWVAQIGAREHYAIARALARENALHGLYTDFWCRRFHSLLRRGPRPLRALAGRYHPDLASQVVIDFKYGLWAAGSQSNRYERYLAIGRAFGAKVAGHLAQQRLEAGRDAYFGYCTGSLEVLQMLKERGVASVVGQIDPARVEEDLVVEERQRWVGWEAETERAPINYWDRLRTEWDSASLVLVNSEWSAQALVGQGVARAKCVVVPLAYEPTFDAMRIAASRTAHQRPLTVLWLGQVRLRKGIPYLLDAARLLAGSNVQFIVAGENFISRQVVASAPSNVRFVGQIDRDQATDWYRRADLFVLPTISDGFGITQLEAMSHGVPVIASTHCGAVVVDGENGLLVPPRDSRAIAEAIRRLDGDRERLQAMSQNAARTSQEYSLARFAQQLHDAVAVLRPAKTSVTR